MAEKAAAVVQKAAPVVEKAVPETEELPKTIVRRIVKEKLNNLSTNGEISVFKDALQAFSESARIFIHYLSATANDICRESKRQTINAEDVFKALEEIEFTEFVEPLKASLEEFRQKNAGKRSASSKTKGENKKQKTESPVENGDGGEEEKQDDGLEQNEANGTVPKDGGVEQNEDNDVVPEDDDNEQNEANGVVPDTESPEENGN